MNELVFLEPNKIDAVPFTTSKVIAEATSMNHRRVRDAIRKHQEDVEAFGLLGAYATESSGGRPEEIFRLNEEQATFLAGYDQYVVLLNGRDGQQLTYKHAISTIIPERPVTLDRPGEEG